MLHELEFKGEIENKLCAICKLHFKTDQRVVSCPDCGSLFHNEHLISWLRIHSSCPVCSRDFSPEIEKYSLRKSNDTVALDIDDIDKLPFREFKFEKSNANEVSEPIDICTRIFGIFLGIFLGFSILIVGSLTTPFPQTLLLCIVEIPLFYIGMILLKGLLTKPKEDTTNFWKEIVFSKNGLIIKNSTLSPEELLAEDIQNHKLDRQDRSSKKTPTTYTITLKLTDQKDNETNFGVIYSSTDKLQREYIYNQLAYQIRNCYPKSANPAYGDGTMEFFSENSKLLGFGSLVYIFLKIALVLIGHFVYQ